MEIGEGNIYGPMDVFFEKGWQTANQFSMIYYIDMESASLKNETIYGNKTTQTTSGGRTTVTTYDEKGRTVLQRATGTLGNNIEKVEATTEYDENGRVLKKTQTIYYSDGKANEVSVLAYTYTDTVEGSEGVCVLDSYTYKLIYDMEYRCVGSVTLLKNEETSRTEYNYDDDGNMEIITSYVEGVQDTKTTYTYKAVTVTREKAEQLPQFIRAQ